MAEYIERGELEGILKTKYERLSGMRPDFYAGFMLAVLIIDNETRNADVAPVRHGYWVGTGDGYADGELVYDMWACSECGFDADGADEKPDWKYCPNCGARMDEEE